MKSNFKKKKHKKTKRLGGLIIDIVCMVFATAVITIEVLKKINFPPLLALLKKINFHIALNSTAELVIVLLPTIITVVSIVLSLMKERIYSVSLNDFNRLRGFWFYNFLHMIICTIVIFTIYTVCYGFSLKYSIIAINIIAIVYSFYFSIQEIPVLLHDKRVISRIIRKRFRNRDRTILLGSQRDEKYLIYIVESIILTEGIETAFKAMSFKRDTQYNNVLLNDLLDIQNHYFWDMREDIEFAKSDINGTYRDIPILNAINKGFDNVEALLTFKNDFDYKKIVDDEDETFQLTRSIFSLHAICRTFKLEEKEKEKMRKIVNRLTLYGFSKGKDNSKHHSFISLMLVQTLPEDETWFIRALADGDYSSFSLFTNEKNDVGLFISIFIAYVLKVFPNNKNRLKQFIDSPFGGFNGDKKSWKYHVCNLIERMNSHSALSILKLLLKIYGSINESYFENIFLRKDSYMSNRVGFEKTYIFNAWLEIIMFGTYSKIEKNEILNVLNELSDNDKSVLAHYLPKKWIQNGSLKRDIKLDFLSFFDEEYIAEENWHNNDIVKALCDFHRRYFKIKTDKTAANHNPNLLVFKNKLIEPFNCLKEDEFFDETINLSKEKYLSYSIRIDSFDCDDLVSAYAKNIKNSIDYSLMKTIKGKACKSRTIVTSGFTLKPSVKEKIKALNPSFASDNDYIYFDKDFANFFMNIRKSESPILPSCFFGKEKSVSFRVSVDTEKTIVRYLYPNEIENIIEKEYQMVNGLYKYSEYKNDEIRSFLVTKDELINYLSKEIKYAQIVFKQKVVLRRGTYLLLRGEKGND